ncbi:hypothetical protein MSAN_01884200 [Mycena sanguinolenta]|uniref:Uncharacterized protein n=1 Tax=Mycena sanguinolenta TaxID=230812 RepID=A0A8H6XU05_9AGAR|nr:hypothetical protein MSAN_01884200 [Mycena sanguinolenta]
MRPDPSSTLLYNSLLDFKELKPVLMFSFLTSPGVVPAVMSSLAVANALCLPCQVGLPTLGQVPLSLKTSRRGGYAPPITSPGASTTWTRQNMVTVTWSTSDIPKSITNPTGRLLLGYLNPGSSNEHLDLDHPLAEGFDIRDGNRTIRVPNVPPRDNYIVVLIGSSGNRSPEFKIV